MKYIVYATEQIMYEIEVEAKDEQEAMDKVYDGRVDLPEPSEYDGFVITEVQTV